MCSLGVSGAPKRGEGGWGLPGCRPPTKSKFKKKKKKTTDFVDGTILKLLSYLPFSRNQPLKSAGDQDRL